MSALDHRDFNRQSLSKHYASQPSLITDRAARSRLKQCTRECETYFVSREYWASELTLTNPLGYCSYTLVWKTTHGQFFFQLDQYLDSYFKWLKRFWFLPSLINKNVIIFKWPEDGKKNLYRRFVRKKTKYRFTTMMQFFLFHTWSRTWHGA